MRLNSFLAFLVAVVLACSAAVARGQGDSTDAIKQQIGELQKQLEFLEKNAEAKGKVTQIGGPKRDGEGKFTSVRVYDVGDLFSIAPSYAAVRRSDLAAEASPLFPSSAEAEMGSGFSGLGGFGGGAAFQVTEGSAAVGGGRTTMEDLIEAITTVISPAAWDSAGGSNSIKPLGASLLVSADNATHEQIDGLLASLRKKWGALRTVSVKSYWLWLDEGEIAGLLDKESAAATGIRDRKTAFGLVDDAAFKKHLEGLQAADAKRAPGYRAVVSLYSGQTISTSSGKQSAVYTGAIPVIDGDNVGYRASYGLVQEGASLQVTPLVTSSGDVVILDIRSRVLEKLPAEAVPPPARSADGTDAATLTRMAALVERHQLMEHRLSTTLRVPIDRTMLVGGMTYGQAEESGQPQLYLFVNTAVQEIAGAADQNKGDKKKGDKDSGERDSGDKTNGDQGNPNERRREQP